MAISDDNAVVSCLIWPGIAQWKLYSFVNIQNIPQTHVLLIYKAVQMTRKAYVSSYALVQVHQGNFCICFSFVKYTRVVFFLIWCIDFPKFHMTALNRYLAMNWNEWQDAKGATKLKIKKNSINNLNCCLSFAINGHMLQALIPQECYIYGFGYLGLLITPKFF